MPNQQHCEVGLIASVGVLEDQSSSSRIPEDNFEVLGLSLGLEACVLDSITANCLQLWLAITVKTFHGCFIVFFWPKQNSFETILKLFCFSFVAVSFQLCGQLNSNKNSVRNTVVWKFQQRDVIQKKWWFVVLLMREHIINGVPSKDYTSLTLSLTVTLTLTLTLTHYFDITSLYWQHTQIWRSHCILKKVTDNP